MSAKVTGFILDHYPHGGAEKLVALALADEANADGDNIFPGVARLAARCCMSERGIQKILRRIEERQVEGVYWFEKVRVGGGGRSLTNRYRCPIEMLDEVLRRTANDVRGLENETPNGVQGKNHEQGSGYSEKPRTERSETPNGGSPDPLYPPYRSEPAEGDDYIPSSPQEWGSLLAKHYRYSLQEVMNVGAIGMFRDWCTRGLPWALVQDAIEAAHAKNGGRPGQPTYYRNFVNQMVAEVSAASEARASSRAANFCRPGGDHRGENNPGRNQTGAAGFYEDFGRGY